MAPVSADENEQNIVTLHGDGVVVVQQIAGLLARRIVFDRESWRYFWSAASASG